MLFYTRWFRVLIGAPLIFSGLWWIWQGQRMWRRPEQVRPGTYMYRHLARYYRRQLVTAEAGQPGLSRGRIRYYAVLVIVGGIIGAGLGVTLALF